MINNTKIISEEELSEQLHYCEWIQREFCGAKPKKVYIQTFGCQQNEADSEKLMAMAQKCGFVPCASASEADLILINTCAVREHAELKALSITGQFKHLKEANPDLLIGICGCMVSQEFRKDDIKFKYPYVSFLLATNMLWKFPQVLRDTIRSHRRQIYLESDVSYLAEGIDSVRQSDYKAWVSIMYGCNNFCTYCIVPYVRGRERSRKKEDVLDEVRRLVSSGYREITLLGQNVNSYDPENGEYRFCDLLTDICKIDGDFIVRFMTSHPKDASYQLIDVMAENKKIAKHFHLPIQSGSDRILKKMNRNYTRQHYFDLVDYMRSKIPGIAITTDIIVGFPGESEEDFCDTLDVLKQVRFDNIFSFVYSKRRGTPAATMPDQIDEALKSERMNRLLEVQKKITVEDSKCLVGENVRVLVEGRSKTDDTMFSGRTETNKIIHFRGEDSLIGTFQNLRISASEGYVIYGELAEPLLP